MHTVTDLDIAGVLAGMATALKARGWCQKDFTDRDGRMCLEGAARFVIAGGPEVTRWAMPASDRALLVKAERSIARVIEGEAEQEVWSCNPEKLVVDWNDEDGRTVDDVLRVLAKAREARELSGGAS